LRETESALKLAEGQLEDMVASRDTWRRSYFDGMHARRDVDRELLGVRAALTQTQARVVKLTKALQSAAVSVRKLKCGGSNKLASKLAAVLGE
jgi:hypothetical protein